MLLCAAVACGGSDDEPFAKDDNGNTRPGTSGAEALASVVKTPVGAGADAVGIEVPEEGNPEGPASFAVDAQGSIHILDQVNGRIQIFSKTGALQGTVKLPDLTYDDIELDGNGGYILLDKHERESVIFFDGNGQETSFIRVAGGPIESPGDVTGLYRTNDGIWLEVDDAALVQIADLAGNPVQTRSTELGRRDKDGRIVLVAIDGNRDVVLTAQTPGATDSTEIGRITFAMDVAHVSAFEYDDDGNVLVGVETFTEGTEEQDFEVQDIDHEIVTVNRMGKEVRRDKLLPKDDPLTQFRTVRRGADGHLYQLKVGDTGAEVVRYVP
jgi:hypothetical protein